MPTPKAFKFFRSSDEYFGENLSKMVNENTVWLSPARDFNDPLEMSSFVKRADVHKNSIRIMEDFRRMVIDRRYMDERLQKIEGILPAQITLGQLREFLDGLRENPEFNHDPYKMLSDGLAQHGSNLVDILSKTIVDTTNKFSDGFYLFCMTDNISNSAMWAYYAENHTGVAIEFYRTSPLSTHARQVTYTDKISDTLVGGLDYLSTKNIYWRHESERRYLVRKDESKKDGEFIGHSNYFRFHKETLEKCDGCIVKAVYIGLNTPESIVQKIVKVIESSGCFIQIYQTGTNIEYYSLEFLPLSETPAKT